MLEYLIGQSHGVMAGTGRREEESSKVLRGVPFSTVGLGDDRLSLKKKLLYRKAKFHVIYATLSIDMKSFKITVSTVSNLTRTFVK